MKFFPATIFFGFLGITIPLGATLAPTHLRCDGVVNPLGVDSDLPNLSWQLSSSTPNQRQTAYQILAKISSPSQKSGTIWDSGQIFSDATLQIPFTNQLNSAAQVFWKVRVWDENGRVSAWSPPATWTMGVLNKTDWHAHWIGAADTNIPSLLLRRDFFVRSGLQRAIVNVCGLGQYELTLNGKKVGADFLSPGWTKYDKTCLYDTRELTADLRAGKNTIGLELGNGMYQVLGGGRYTKFKGSFGPQKAIAQIRLEYRDGSVEYVGTDDHWRTAPGPITFSSIYGGEDFDARLLHKNWNQPDFIDTNWTTAQIVNGPGGELRGLSAAAPPLTFFETHHSVATHTLTNGDVVFDLGQNASHVPQIAVTGPAGSKIRLLPAELLDTEGAVNQSSMGAGHRGTQWCEFTKGTDGLETWAPKFFYIGCRYIQVHCTAANLNSPLPKIKNLSASVMHSASEPVGEFTCSNPLFNRIRQLVRWAQRSNMVSLMTDCPHRERLGWLEEDHLNGPALRYEFDLAQLFNKTLNDIADSQLANGLVPTTAPEYTIFRDKNNPAQPRNLFGDSPEWSSSCILVPWQQYEFAGDVQLLRKRYDLMKNYLAYFATRADHNIVNYGLGDWYDVGPNHPGVSQLTPIALTATAFYFQDTAIMAQIAALLGQKEDAKNFSDRAEEIRRAFNVKFFNAEKHNYATGSQCANAIPLVMDLCAPAERAAVLDDIVRDVRAHGNALTAGDVGYRYLLRALADGGRTDVIFDINNQTNQPGYGMQLAKGKTSLTEAWDGGSSQNHFMLGQIQEWFYHDLAGIQSGGDGFKQINIAPQPVGDVTWVKASYDSVRGRIISNWKRAGGKFTLVVTIPPNTTANVYLPAQSPDLVCQSKGTTFIRMQNKVAIFGIGSGTYNFETPEEK